MCSCLTLKLQLHQSSWYELHVAFFMLAYWIILTGFEVREKILVNQLISCMQSFSPCRQSSRMLYIISTQNWACAGMMSTYIDTLRDILLLYVHLCFCWGWSTRCPVIPQIEPALDSSFINWECVTFEVQLQGTLRRWILWIHSFTTPPQFFLEHADKSSLIDNQQIWPALKPRQMLAPCS